MHKIMFDPDRGRAVLTELVEAFYDRELVFGRDDLMPQRRLPIVAEKDKFEHSMYLFIMTMYTRVKTSRFYERASVFFMSEYDLLYPKQLAAMDVEDVARRLKDMPYELAGKRAAWLVEAADKLLAEYDGDPLNIFRAAADSQDLYARIMDFKGYGPETSRLLATYYHTEGLFKLPFQIEPKIDFHDIRFLLHMGLMKIVPYEGSIQSSRLTQPSRDFILETCEEAGLNVADVDYAMWILGSNLCVQQNFLTCKEDCPMSRYFNSPMPSTDNNLTGRIYLVDMRFGAAIPSKRRDKNHFWPWKNAIFVPELLE